MDKNDLKPEIIRLRAALDLIIRVYHRNLSRVQTNMIDEDLVDWQEQQWLEEYQQYLEEQDMKVGDIYVQEGKSLKAEDLQGKARELTISGYEIVEFSEGKKAAIQFHGAKKTLVLNFTNSARITANLGTDEMDNWTGRKIVIYPTTTDFGGKIVPCIRVKEEMPETVTDFDDDIPF